MDAEAFACVILPSGKIDYTCSGGIKRDAVACEQRDIFLAALQLMVNKQRLQALNNPQAVRAAKRRLPSGSTAEAAKKKQQPPSKHLRQAARAAFSEHVLPLLDKNQLQLCNPKTWSACKVHPGQEACSAGGGCQRARAALGWWPAHLPLVDPSRAALNKETHKAILLLLEDRGCSVEMPIQAAATR